MLQTQGQQNGKKQSLSINIYEISCIIHTVKDLKKIIKERRCLVFIDLEATQISHEMIQLGAIKTYIGEDQKIKKVFKPFQTYVKPKHFVGKYVTQLTGINDLLLKREGVSYRVALNSFKKYCGKDFYRALFVVYGSSDGSIFYASMENNLDASKEDTLFIVRHIFDFGNFLLRYVKSDDGNQLSLTHALNAFGIAFDGQAHDALQDAKNLMTLYKATLENPDILSKEYKKTLLRFTVQNSAISEAIQRLANGQDVTAKEFDQMIEDSFQ